jgi:hypothetical protein
LKSSYLSISPLNSVGLFTEDLGCPPPAAGAAAAGRFWVMPLAMAFCIAVWNAFMSNSAAIVGIGGLFRIGSVVIGMFRSEIGGNGLYAKNARGSLGRSWCEEGPGVGASLFSPSSESPVTEDAMEDGLLRSSWLARLCSRRSCSLCRLRSLEGRCW